MRNYNILLGWIIGYFVVLFPLMCAYDGSLIEGLFRGILGVLVAIIIITWRPKK